MSVLDQLPPALAHLAPPPRKVRYAQVGHAAQFPLPRTLLEEVWSDPWLEDDRVCFRRTTTDITATPRVVEDALVAYGPDGLVDLGIYGAADTLSRWDPPHVVLPPEPTVGATWTDTHVRAGKTSTRTVTLVESPDRPGCIMSVAESRRDDGVMVLRMHYAPGDGFVGYEALIQKEGRPTVRTWTESLAVQPR